MKALDLIARRKRQAHLPDFSSESLISSDCLRQGKVFIPLRRLLRAAGGPPFRRLDVRIIGYRYDASP